MYSNCQTHVTTSFDIVGDRNPSPENICHELAANLQQGELVLQNPLKEYAQVDVVLNKWVCE